MNSFTLPRWFGGKKKPKAAVKAVTSATEERPKSAHYENLRFLDANEEGQYLLRPPRLPPRPLRLDSLQDDMGDTLQDFKGQEMFTFHTG